MKLIVEVDEYKIEACKRHVKERYASWYDDMVANGTPLSKIKDEIERKITSGQWSEATVYGLKKAIAVIDKYLEETE